MSSVEPAVGRAKAMLVFGAGTTARAVAATLAARSLPSTSSSLEFAGPVTFTPAVVAHLREVVLPIAHQIASILTPGRDPATIELSVVNLAAASAINRGLDVSGFSADGAAFLAILSALLALPVSQDVAITAHLASSHGDIQWVGQIPAKVAAAVSDPSIRAFVCPSTEIDESLRTLAPGERERAEVAIAQNRGKLRIRRVTRIDELVESTCSDEGVALAALSSGYFNLDSLGTTDGQLSPPVKHALAFLSRDHGARFERALEGRLLHGSAAAARTLMQARARFHLRHRSYPHGFGRQLLSLVMSMPPAVRQNKSLFPLLPPGDALELCHLATATDYSDVQDLLAAVGGTTGSRSADTLTSPQLHRVKPQNAVLAVINEISPETLDEKISVPIDSARASYAIDGVKMGSKQAFYAAIDSFCLWMLRRLDSPAASADSVAFRSESERWLNSAFKEQGGADAAWAEAHRPSRGGMRYVLDRMTEYLKADRQALHIDRVLKDAVDGLNWEEEVAFMAALLEHARPLLPPDLHDQPPEAFAGRHESLVHAFVRAASTIRGLFDSR